MKTERRHDLETNVLAKGITDWSEKLRPYTSALLAGIALLLLVYIASSMWAGYRARRERSAWDAYQLAVFSDDGELKQLQQAATGGDYDGTEMQEWAYVAWADRQLHQASRRYLIDREDANERLQAISAVYEQFAKDATDPEVRNRARLGLARVNEMQNRLDEARKHYGMVEGALSTIAKDRLTALESKDAKEVIQWLATAELPKPTMPRGPGSPGVRPGMDATLPSADTSESTFDAKESLDAIIGGIEAGETSGRYVEPVEDAADEPMDDAPAEDADSSADQSESAEPADAAEERESQSDEAPSDEAPSDEDPPAKPAAPETPAES